MIFKACCSTQTQCIIDQPHPTLKESTIIKMCPSY